MKICLKKKSYFTFRGVESYELDLLGKSVLELMREHLQTEEDDGEGERVVLEPVYPFLTRDELFTFLDGREGSYRFKGGFVVRNDCPMSNLTRANCGALGQGLFSLTDYPAVLVRAAKESAAYHLKCGALVEEGAVVSFAAEILEGVIVQSGARILGKSVIGENAEIGAGSEITDSLIGAGTVVRCSTLIGATVGKNCSIGPNAYLRPGSVVGDNCRIGDFVELKNAKIDDGSKVAHLAYVGDAELGKNVNVGCGAVFVNYDGKNKRHTTVGESVFIGSNCNLIAPLSIGDGAFIAAGTTLTKNLQEDDFCIGRCRETIKPHRAKR